MGAIFQFFTALLAKISAVASWLLAVVKRVFDDLWNIVTDLACWVLESVLGLASSALSTIDVPFNPQTYYGMLPPDVVNMLGVIGLTQALTMIVAALVVRFLLQTIPFVRWGS
ncbi:DUF2523 family protein [Pseudomonas sp. TCU-HL1]|uniref:DUF2523 family protein n=1 Tax=Pseudomonas sp. TCU-HL1 TaxID=1856685 RepID=UPI00083E18CD|nr:DUF2523 family protein [Pseudomonas sp. TCU-HL1]AOE85622.1 hypothetical protein THL1_3074 [Pseudomonas sp. TCU-HL1]AOE85647.1 hypothetical protein THL1_3099 [Pseudomonas sp. TCU-HL1]